jgi:hypothetical protein
MSDVVTTFEPQLDRASALRPIVNQLLQLVRQRAGQGGTLKISVGPHSIEMSSWERAQVLEGGGGEGEVLSETALLLLDGVAAQARALNNLVRYLATAEDNAEGREQCLRDLVFDMALASRVRADVAALAAALNEEGKPGQARYLEQFLERFDENMAHVQAGAGEESVRSAQALVDDMAQRTAAAAEGDAAEPAGLSAGPAPHDTSAGEAPLPKGGIRRSHAIMVSLATVVLVVGTLVAVPLATQRYEIQDGFRYMQGVVSWEGAPPHVRVTVVTSQWNALAEPDRTAMIFGIAAAVQKKGFTTADVLTQDGKVVARWDRENGITQ